MQHFVLYVTGVSGSGKTTLGSRAAAQLGLPFADGDDFHPPENVAKMRSGQPLDDHDRAGWLAAIHDFVRQKLDSGTGVVVACSALKQIYRDQLSRDFPPHQVRWAHLVGDFDLILERMQARPGHFMPPGLLRSQFTIWEEPTEGLLLDVRENLDSIVSKIKNHMLHKSELGLVGLGVMGRNLARNFARNGIQLSLYNRFVAGKEERVAAQAIADFPELSTAQPFEDVGGFIESLATPRRIFLMVEAGAAVDAVLGQMLPLLAPGDVVMDGGNSHYADTERRQREAEATGVYFLGVGVSGGESGALNGPAIMVGGQREAFDQVEPFLGKIAARDFADKPCLGYIGPGGAGHFVKMVHNGIEYAEMQLLAETYSAMRWEMGYSPDEVAECFKQWWWGLGDHRSYLLEITADILRRREGEGWLLDVISDKASHKGTGSWAAVTACEMGVPLSMMTAALFARFTAAQKNYRERLSDMYPAHGANLNLQSNDLKITLQLARIINHHEGFQLIRVASERFGWQVDLPELARVWTNGCIIRSDLLAQTIPALSREGDLLQSPDFALLIRSNRPIFQQTVSELCRSSRAYPCFSAALVSLNGLTTAVSAGHLIQAQRDYFGAHLYERTDDPTGKKYHTDWSSHP